MSDGVHIVFNTVAVNEKHVCFFTKDNGDGNITLLEVVERSYEHPDSQGSFFYPVLEIVNKGTYNRTSREASSLILLEAANNNLL